MLGIVIYTPNIDHDVAGIQDRGIAAALES